MRNFRIIFTIFLLATSHYALVATARAQTSEERITELRQQIADLERQAASYKGTIAEEQAKAQTLKRDIGILKSEIGGLETQITLTGKKIDKTEIEITKLGDQIFDTEQSIVKQKETIGRLVLLVNRSDHESLLATLVKNQNLSDFFHQAQYTATMNTQLLGLVGQLQDEKTTLEGSKDQVEGKKRDLETLNREQAARKSSLASTKNQKDTLLVQTKGQEAQYQKMLVDVERRRMEFFTELRKLENEAIAGGLYIVHITASSIPPRGTKLFQWPEDEYRLTQGYGMTKYARRGAYGGAPHNGIDIASGYGTPIKAIGDGEIAANGTNDGWGNWVAVQHPNGMTSVYAHMSALSFMRVGTAVRTGDVIGYEGSTGNASGSHLHLSLYRDFFTYVNEKKNQLYFNYFEGSLNPLDYL